MEWVLHIARTALLPAIYGTLIFFTPLWAPRVIFRSSSWTWFRHNQAPRQPISMVDLAALFVLLAFVNAALGAARAAGLSSRDILRLAAAANVASVLMWLLALRFMRRAAITHPYKRFLFQTVLYPASIVVAGNAVATAVMLLMYLIEMLFNISTLVWNYPVILLHGAELIVALSLCWLLRYAFHRWFLVEPSTVG